METFRRNLNGTRAFFATARAIGLMLTLLWTASAAAQEHFAEGEEQLLALINQERAKDGIAPLQLNEALSRAARKHTMLMARNDSVAHQLPGEEPLMLRVSEENVRCDRDAENIAMGGNVAETHTLVMNSPPHRANVLNPQFNSVGIGIVQDGELTYVTEDFAHVLPNYSEMEADAAAQETITEYARSQRFPAPVRKPRPELKKVACNMARDDKLDSAKAQNVAGARSAVAWTSNDLGQLPSRLKKFLEEPLPAGYALGVCFAPSATYPSGVYWLVMVIY